MTGAASGLNFPTHTYYLISTQVWLVMLAGWLGLYAANCGEADLVWFHFSYDVLLKLEIKIIIFVKNQQSGLLVLCM